LGQRTRGNIDEFTTTTARAIERVGGAERGRAVIILNPFEPPMIMRAIR
jgi:acetaldehyde dehydrogenase